MKAEHILELTSDSFNKLTIYNLLKVKFMTAVLDCIKLHNRLYNKMTTEVVMKKCSGDTTYFKYIPMEHTICESFPTTEQFFIEHFNWVTQGGKLFI